MCEAKMPAYALPCPMAGQVFSWDRWGVKTPGAVERRWRATHRKDTDSDTRGAREDKTNRFCRDTQ